MVRAAALALVATTTFFGVSTPAWADKAVPLGEISSPVYETTGDHQAITRRGATCLAQILKPGVVTAPTILATDIEGGRVVANNAYQYIDKWMISTLEQGRSIVTLEAKDGKFRLVHSSIEVLNVNSGWNPAAAWSKKFDTDPARLKLLEISETIAKCVQASSAQSADW